MCYFGGAGSCFPPLPLHPNLAEAKLKSYGLTALAEDISKQHSIDCISWLLVAMFRQMYNKKEEVEQEKIQNGQFVQKGGSRKCKQT